MLCNILTTIDILFSLQLHSFGIMNIKLLISLCVLVLTASIVESCKEPIQETDTSHLLGNWVVVNAKRNAKLTSTLNEAYFMFKPDSTLETNFIGEDIMGTYEIDGNVISHNAGEKLDFTIVNLSRDTLILSTQIMDHNFEFFLLNERLDPFNKNQDEIDLFDENGDRVDIDS